jgi:DnaJ-domain-containing protein 1
MGCIGLRERAHMVNLYSVFGLSPGASSDAIKAAYYRLAKRYHPDTHAGETAQERIREINQAYETLGDPVARAAYDVMLVRERSETRRRTWKAVATGASTFTLTLGLFPLLMSWTLQVPTSPPEITQLAVFAPNEDPTVKEFAESFNVGPPATDFAQVNTSGDFLFGVDMLELQGQPQRIEPELELPLSSELSSEREAQQYERAEPTPSPPLKTDDARTKTASTSSAGPAIRRARPARWTVHQNTRFGFALKYPQDVFTKESNEREINDRLLISGDGRGLLRIHSKPTPTSITRYRASLVAGRYAGATFDYAPQRDSWFVLSGTLGEEMFYERVTISCDGRSVHGWLLTYPVAERSFYDPIVEEIHRSYKYGDRCGAPASRLTRVRAPGANQEPPAM